MLLRLAQCLQKLSRISFLVVFLCAFMIMGIVMESRFAGSAGLKKISGGTGMVDMQVFYTPEKAYSMLNSMGNEGRQFYIRLLYLDSLFSICFMLAHSALISFLVQKAGADEKWMTLNLLPFARSFWDALENGFLLVMLSRYPETLPLAATLACGMTILKWLTYAAALAATAFLLIMWIYKRMNGRKTAEGGKRRASFR